MQACDHCGRGIGALSNEPDSHMMDKDWSNEWQHLTTSSRKQTIPDSESSMSQKQTNPNLSRITSSWQGVYCDVCGRGCKIDQESFGLNKADNQASTAFLLHNVMRSWILSGCSSCLRKGEPLLVCSFKYPIPLIHVLNAWRGSRCSICGLGTNNTSTTNNTVTSIVKKRLEITMPQSQHTPPPLPVSLHRIPPTTSSQTSAHTSYHDYTSKHTITHRSQQLPPVPGPLVRQYLSRKRSLQD